MFNWGDFMIVQMKNICKSYNERLIIENVNLCIQKHEKIGIVGENGSGKSTLAKVLIGEVECDNGVINPSPFSLNITYLPQSMFVPSDIVTREEQAKLNKLGLKNSYKNEYSSGEMMKLALAKVWSGNPELVILDEPTNHLDRDGVEWLIDEIRNFNGAVLIISHDRYFLDQTVTKIVEIEHQRINEYNGNYSEYKEEKEKRRQIQIHHYESQVKVVRELEGQIQTLKQWSNSAHQKAGKGGTRSENRQLGLREFERKKAKKRDQQTKSMIKRLTKEIHQVTLLKPKEESTVQIHFQNNEKQGKRMIQATNLTIGYGMHLLIKDSHFYINQGERIGLIGKNGTGKTTLLKSITGSIPILDGELWWSDSIKIGYLSQTHNWNDLDISVLDYISPGGLDETTNTRTMLVNIGLPREMHDMKMNHLSFGEKTRVELVKMMVKRYDLLILDEPTNHLDIKSREMLEQTLTFFEGTLLIVSHDQYLVNNLCDTILVMDQNKITRYEMSYEQYVNRDLAVSDTKAELLRIQNRMDYVIGRLSTVLPGSSEYVELDQEFQSLLFRKKELQK